MRPAPGATTAVPGVGASNQGHCINVNGRQIDYQDSNDNYDQEVNFTNIGPVCPSVTGRLERRMNQR